MIFTIKSKKDNSLQKAYIKSMKELNEFFELNWTKNKPKLFLVENRETINKLMSQNTQDWIVGWTSNLDIYILNKENYEKESCHKYSKEEYENLIKHELIHCFTQTYTKNYNKQTKPNWLWEGIAIYLSNQNKTMKKPRLLKEFLKFYSKSGSKVYYESGFAIEFLVKKYGKQKILKLLKELKNIKSEKEFKNKFKEIYGFKLNYKNFN